MEEAAQVRYWYGMDTDLIRLVPFSGMPITATTVAFSVQIPAATDDEVWLAIGIVVFELLGKEATVAILCCDEALLAELEIDPNNSEQLAGVLRDILTNAALHLFWLVGASPGPGCWGIGTLVRPQLAVRLSYDPIARAFGVSTS